MAYNKPEGKASIKLHTKGILNFFLVCVFRFLLTRENRSSMVVLSLKRSLCPSIYHGSELSLYTYCFSLRYKILLVPADRKKRADTSIPFLAKFVYPFIIWRHIVLRHVLRKNSAPTEIPSSGEVDRKGSIIR